MRIEGVKRMIIIFQAAIALQSLLFALEASIPWCRSLLPLGGSHVSQTGIVMAIAVALFEATTLIYG